MAHVELCLAATRLVNLITGSLLPRGDFYWQELQKYGVALGITDG